MKKQLTSEPIQIKQSGNRPLVRLQAATTVVEQATLILKLQERSVRAPQMQAYLETLLISENHQLVRLASAQILSLRLREQSPPMVISTLLEILQDAEPLSALYDTLPVLHRDIVTDISHSLALAGPRQAERLIPPLITALNQYSYLSAAEVSAVLVYLAFDNQPVPPTLTMSAMTPLQQQVLYALLSSSLPWKWMDMRENMTFFGLPTTCEALLRFSET